MIPVKSRTVLSLAAVVGLMPVLTACPGDSVVDVVEVANIELAHPTEAVALGDNLQLEAAQTSSSGEALNRAITWSSNNTAVATVSPTGLVTTVGAGTAIISASADGASASTTVHVVDLPCESNGTIRPGDSSSGTLNSDCFYTSGVDEFGRDLAGRYADLWLLPVSTAGTVQIDMTSEFDTYLRLTDQAHVLIDQNDDRVPGDTNSSLSLTLSPGIYIIEATTFRYDVTGTYQLSMSQ